MQDIPIHSADLIAELSSKYKPHVIGAAEMATEQARLNLAIRQGKVELVQEMVRALEKQKGKQTE